MNLDCNRAEPRPPTGARCLVLAQLLLLLIGTDCGAAQFGIPQVEGEEIEEVAADARPMIEISGKAQRRQWTKQMEEEVSAISAAVALDATQRKALEELSRSAVEKSMSSWTARMQPILGGIQSSIPNAEFLAPDEVLPGFPGPYYASPADELPFACAFWKDGVQSILTPRQKEAWTRAELARHEEWAAEMKLKFQPVLQQHREEVGTGLSRKAADTIRALSLAPDRAKPLENFANGLVDAATATLEVDLTKALATEPRQNLEGIQLNRWTARVGGRHRLDIDKLWNQGLQHLLSPPELKELKQQQAKRANRLREAKSLCLLAYLDEKLAFTSQQRAQLLPIARRLVPKPARSKEEDEEEDEDPFGKTQLFALAAKAREQDLKPVLDSLQRERWRETCKPVEDPEAKAQEVQRAASSANASSEAEEIEPADYEPDLSDYLQSKSEPHQKDQMTRMLIEAEDAARTIPLGKEQAARLTTAARGATEEVLREWRVELEQQVRSVTDQYEGGRLKSYLAAIDMQPDVFTRDDTSQIEERPLWRNALQTLTPDQLGKWHKGVQEREAFREAAATSTVLASFDHLIGLSTLQWNALEADLREIVHDYRNDLLVVDSSVDDGTPWFGSSSTSLLPLLVMDDRLKSRLDADQWERWMKSQELAECLQYWSQVREAHEKRATPEVLPR